MASSKISYAQEEFLIPCDRCDTCESASSFCKQCLVNVCHNCEQSHNQHTMIPLIEGLLFKLHFKMECAEHQQKIELFCKTCEDNICKRCFVSNHGEHEVENVGSGKHGEILRQKLSKNIQCMKVTLSKIPEQLDSILEHKINFEKQTENNIKNVLSIIRERKKLLDADGRNITQMLKLEQKEASEKLQNYCNELHYLDHKLKALIESLETNLARIPDEAVPIFVNENETELEAITFDLPRPSEFTPSVFSSLGTLTSTPSVQLNFFNLDEYTKSALQEIEYTSLDPPASTFSSVNLKPKTINPLLSLRPELDIIHRFSFKQNSMVLSICATNDDMFWVGTGDCNLILFDKTGQQKLEIKLSGRPRYTAVIEPGDVLVSTGRRVIYKVTRQGQLSTFVNVTPNRVWGITTTKQGNVFVCVETGPNCNVWKYTSDGRFLQAFDYKLFKSRRQDLVHVVRDNVVCVQDGQPDFEGECQLVLVTAFGQVVSRITRTDQLREHTYAIVWDEHGNVLTGTWHQEYIHVFSGEGVCKKSYEVKDSGAIMSICVGKDGVIWIGTIKGEVIIARYLQ